MENVQSIFSPLISWIQDNGLQLLISAACIAAYAIFNRVAQPRLKKHVADGQFQAEAARKAINTTRIIVGIVTLLSLAVVWGFDIRSLMLLTTTTITLLGVALFATWSILSNVTAYFALLLQPSFQRGNFVRIIDADNYVEGYITELRLLNTQLETESGEIVVYPNNLIIGRPAIINPRQQLKGVGKITDTPAPQPQQDNSAA